MLGSSVVDIEYALVLEVSELILSGTRSQESSTPGLYKATVCDNNHAGKRTLEADDVRTYDRFSDSCSKGQKSNSVNEKKAGFRYGLAHANSHVDSCMNSIVPSQATGKT